MTIEHSLYFFELDPIAAQLDLVIDSSERIDFAIGKQPRQISRPVKPRARG